MSEPDLPTFDEYWALFTRPAGIRIVLTPRQIYAVGHVITQWAFFDDQVNFLIGFWRCFPQVPREIANRTIRAETRYRLAHLRDELAPELFLRTNPNWQANLREEWVRQQDAKERETGLPTASSPSTTTRTSERFASSTRGTNFEIATAKVEALAEDIGFLSTWLMQFTSRLHEDEHRALHDKLRQQVLQQKKLDT